MDAGIVLVIAGSILMVVTIVGCFWLFSKHM
jgi:hypothetical protein